MSPIPLVTNSPVQSASGSHMTEANPEPAAVQASGHHPNSTAPLGADTNAEVPSDVAMEEAPLSRAEIARNSGLAAAGTTMGKTLPCTACMCAKEMTGYSGMCHSHCCSGSMICTAAV